MKQIQGLPDNTSNSACLALLGILPIETILHKNLLSMYVNMIRNGDSIEYEIAQRQLVMKEPHQKSLFNFIKDSLELYELPSIFYLLNTPPSKEKWKGMLNHKIHEKVESLWQADINSKSSTKHINSKALIVGKCHHIWSTVRNNIHDNRRAQFKCKLLTGTYILQANRVRCFNQEILNTSCLSLTLALQRSNESYKLIKHPLKRINILSSIGNLRFTMLLLSFSQQYFTLAALSSSPEW